MARWDADDPLSRRAALWLERQASGAGAPAPTVKHLSVMTELNKQGRYDRMTDDLFKLTGVMLQIGRGRPRRSRAAHRQDLQSDWLRIARVFSEALGR